MTAATKREVYRCLVCRLVQFRTEDHKCRRCSARALILKDFPARKTKLKTVPKGQNIAVVRRLGNRVREIRYELGISQAEFIKVTGWKRKYIWSVEKGTTMPGIAPLERAASALHMGMSKFFLTSEERIVDSEFLCEVATLTREFTEEKKEQLLHDLEILWRSNGGDREIASGGSQAAAGPIVRNGHLAPKELG